LDLSLSGCCPEDVIDKRLQGKLDWRKPIEVNLTIRSSFLQVFMITSIQFLLERLETFWNKCGVVRPVSQLELFGQMFIIEIRLRLRRGVASRPNGSG
jgi:hypothetical protein